MLAQQHMLPLKETGVSACRSEVRQVVVKKGTSVFVCVCCCQTEDPVETSPLSVVTHHFRVLSLKDFSLCVSLCTHTTNVTRGINNPAFSLVCSWVSSILSIMEYICVSLN